MSFFLERDRDHRERHVRTHSCPTRRPSDRKSGGRAPVDTGLGTLGGSAAASGRLSGPGAVIVMSCTLRAGLASFPWAAAPPDTTSATMPKPIPNALIAPSLLPKQAKGRSAAAGLSIRVPEQCQPQKSRSGGADVADPAQYGRDPRRENCASRARPRGSCPLVCRTGFARRRGSGDHACPAEIGGADV